MRSSLQAALIAALLLLCGGVAKAQTQVEYHHIVGKYFYKGLKEAKAPANLVTLLHSSNDKWGVNYLFVDMNMGGGNLQTAYTEIHRYTKFWKAPIYILAQYNSGVTRGNDAAFHHSYLGGVAWMYDNREKQAFFRIDMAYRYDQGWARPHNMALQMRWNWTSWDRLFTLCGDGIITTQNIEGVKSGVRLAVGPQFWVNLNQFVGVHDDFDLSIGTEINLNYSLVTSDKFYVLPSVGAKWTFK